MVRIALVINDLDEALGRPTDIPRYLQPDLMAVPVRMVDDSDRLDQIMSGAVERTYPRDVLEPADDVLRALIGHAEQDTVGSHVPECLIERRLDGVVNDSS